MTVYQFTACGLTGATGPSQTQVNSAYTGSNPLAGTVTSVNGIQEWTVPTTGTYRIEAQGAQGGGNGGKGANMIGTFTLTAGQVLQILVGQQGLPVPASGYIAGGGGGTFVVDKATGNPLMVAGGGGGGGGASASLSTSGTGGGGDVTNNGAGGTATNGGGSGSATFPAAPMSGDSGAGGGGFSGSGAAGKYYSASGGIPGGGKSFTAGGTGGSGSTSTVDGGFGGGGGGGSLSGGSGGGGGYAGGGGGGFENCAGGGGGSYNSGTDVSNSTGTATGNGYVTISDGQTTPTNNTPAALNLVAPTDKYRVTTRPVFVATIGDDVENDKQNLKLQLATDSAFTSNLLEYNTQTSLAGWEVNNGTSWLSFPTGGVDSTYEGKQVRYTKQSDLSEATSYYWRMAPIDGTSGVVGAWSTVRQIHVGNTLQFKLKTPISTSALAKKIVIASKSSIPTDGVTAATVKVEVCNNGLDANPTWEDATAAYQTGVYYLFTNTQKTAPSWAIDCRITVVANDSTGVLEFDGIGFSFN